MSPSMTGSIEAIGPAKGGGKFKGGEGGEKNGNFCLFLASTYLVEGGGTDEG